MKVRLKRMNINATQSKNTNIDVSVIIPTNRTDHWLDLAIESVLNENRISVEIILVLDGVPVPQASWVNHSSLVVLERIDSGGPGAAMRDGVNIARGKYIARLDSDDVSLPERLWEQKQFLDNNPGYAAVSAQIQRIDENGNITGDISLPSGLDIRRGLLLYNFVPHSTLMFRSALGETAGGYNSSLRQMEDYEFLLRLARLGPICQLGSLLVQYRVHNAQTSRGAKARGNHISAVLKTRNILAKELKQLKVITMGKNLVWRAVQVTRVYGLTKPQHLK